jgi:hypothetical protein
MGKSCLTVGSSRLCDIILDSGVCNIGPAEFSISIDLEQQHFTVTNLAEHIISIHEHGNKSTTYILQPQMLINLPQVSSIYFGEDEKYSIRLAFTKSSSTTEEQFFSLYAKSISYSREEVESTITSPQVKATPKRSFGALLTNVE